MSDQADFELTADETPRDRFGRPIRKAPDDRSGRKRGATSQLTRDVKALALKRGIYFIDRMWDRAERLEDEGDIKCAMVLFSRVWPKQRGAPIEIDLSQNVDARTLLMAMMQGQLTPADAASLWNSLSRNGNGHTPAEIAGPARDDVRERIGERLAGIVAARQAIAESHAVIPLQPEPEVLGACAPNSSDDDDDSELDAMFAELKQKWGE